ncbi:hypothetical protein F5Y16DRAFT_412669 [Xylariaceae sp. FL0255]|nr:hypothetical protein F5Y16DRAFT_412669 [Xylariaceae sp. FL0255]
MDPISAIGLASSVVQLLDFAGKLVSKSKEIYRSGRGSLVKHDEIEAVTKTLETQSRRIALQANSFQRSSSETGRDLLELCDGVRTLSRTLITTIDSVRCGEGSGRWTSFLQALRTVWKEKEITDMRERLQRYRQQVDSLLLTGLQERLQVFAQTADDRHARIEDSFNKMLGMLQPGSTWQAQLIEAAHRSLLQQLPDQDQGPGSGMKGRNQESGVVTEFSESLSAGAQQDRDDYVKRRLLASLKFPDMRDRYEGIPEAHKKTYWLMSNKPLFWVTGKPGSGKSTLMKYLSTDERLQRHLSNSGTSLQMSRIGLIRSLLHQIISLCLGEIPRVFPDRWEYQELFELSQGLLNLTSDQRKSFFFLVDGLDEFDGDSQGLVDFLFTLVSTRPNIKLCVSNRPWLVFEDAFRSRPSLRTEDLTISDIRQYTLDKLTENAMFSRLQDMDKRAAASLINDVTAKASGSLLEGLQDGDTIDDLQARLLQIPRDLEALFEKILGDLQPTYLDQASRVFQVVRTSHMPWREMSMEDDELAKPGNPDEVDQSRDNRSPLVLLSLSFIEEDPQRAFEAAYASPMKPDEQRYRAETMRRRLHSRCRGLLEAPAYATAGPNARVQYLHRTVKDYLDEDRARRLLHLNSPSLDASLILCASLLRHAKAISPKEDESMAAMEIFGDLLAQFMMQCHWLEKEGRCEYVAFLDEMNQSAESILTPGDEMKHGVQSKAAMSAPEPEFPHWTKRIDPFIGRKREVHCLMDYAVLRSLTCYVRYKYECGYSLAQIRNKDHLRVVLRQNQNLRGSPRSPTQTATQRRPNGTSLYADFSVGLEYGLNESFWVYFV